jgi:quercetin dioxygenase-like cupin family protein
MRIKFMFCLLVTVACIYLAGLSASAQEMNSSGRNVTEMKMTTIPGLPTCAMGSVQSGSPTNGASIIFAKLPDGCSIPWHWHTPTEHVMIVSGVVRMDMKDAKSLTLRAGGFVMLSPHHVHQARCAKACSIYIYSDVAFDIHYVNGQGKEISPAEALKIVGEKAATEMK